jgi:hypothetical protein
MKTLCLPFLFLGLITVGNCNPNAISGSGNVKTESRSVGTFTKVELTGSPDVEVTVGSDISVSVTTDDNILPAIETKVEGDTLSIGSKQSYNTSLGVTVKITVPKLDGASVTGSGDIHAAGIKGGTIHAGVTGSGDVTLKGEADRLEGEVTGSGNLHAGDLSAKDVRVTVTGSGDATVRATEKMEASVTGSGDVSYYGNPPQVLKNVTGSGSIAPR